MAAALGSPAKKRWSELMRMSVADLKKMLLKFSLTSDERTKFGRIKPILANKTIFLDAIWERQGGGARGGKKTKTKRKRGKKTKTTKKKFPKMMNPMEHSYDEIPLSPLRSLRPQCDLSWDNRYFKKQNVDEFEQTLANGELDPIGSYVFIVVSPAQADPAHPIKEDQIRYVNLKGRGKSGCGHYSLTTAQEKARAERGFKAALKGKEDEKAFKVRYAGMIYADKDGNLKKYRNKSGHWHPPGKWMMVFAQHWGLPQDKSMWERISAKQQYIEMLEDPDFYEDRDDIRAALASLSSYGDEFEIYDDYYALDDSSFGDGGYYDDSDGYYDDEYTLESDYGFAPGHGPSDYNVRILQQPARAMIYPPNRSVANDYEVIVPILMVSVLLLCVMYWLACFCWSAFTVINWRKEKRNRTKEYASEQDELCCV